MQDGDGAAASAIRIADVRRCSGCSSLDYVRRVLRRNGLTGAACAYCGKNEFWSAQALTRFQTKAFEDFHDRHRDRDETEEVGTDADAPIWRCGQG